MRLSSSSLVMASASTSCSVRSENFFTGLPLGGGPTASILGLFERKASVLRSLYGLWSSPETSKEKNAFATPAPSARAGHPAAGPSVLALFARRHAGRARPGDRRPGPRLPGQAFLCGRLASARRRRGDRRDAAHGAGARTGRGRQYPIDRAAAPARHVLQQAGVAPRPCGALYLSLIH